MRKIYVYAGYYELFITDKELPKPYVWLSTHDEVWEAEDWAFDEDPDVTHIIDCDLEEESNYRYLFEDEDIDRVEVAGLFTAICV